MTDHPPEPDPTWERRARIVFLSGCFGGAAGIVALKLMQISHIGPVSVVALVLVPMVIAGWMRVRAGTLKPAMAVVGTLAGLAAIVVASV